MGTGFGRLPPPLAALAISAFVLGMIWTCGQWFSDSRMALSLYEHAYLFNSGHRLAEQLSLAAADESHSCIILGPSTAREGFDPDVLNETLPGVKFFNGGGTGGSYQVQESQAAVMRRYGLHPYCVIVVINPWIMIAGPNRLEGDGFLGLLTRADIAAFALKPIEDPANHNLLQQAWLNTLLPHRRHAWQIGRILREAIYHVHAAVFGSRALPIAKFGNNEYELVKPETRFAGNTTRWTDEQFAELRKQMGPLYFDANNYGNPTLDQPLLNALETLRKLTPRLFVVRTPEGPILDIPNSYVAPYLTRLISHFPPEAVYMDMSGTLPGDLLVDHIHPLPQGRIILSRELGRRIAEHLSTQPR